MLFRFHFPVVLLTTLAMLSGCSSSQPPRHPASQDARLASLIAGAQFVRDDCRDSRVPSDPVLRKTAVHLGHERNWHIDVSRETHISKLASQRYDALKRDNISTTQKCSRLQPVLAPFIDTALTQASSA